MAGNSPHDAVRNFLDPLKRAISCITNSIIIHTAGKNGYQLGVTNGLFIGSENKVIFKVSAAPPLRIETAMQFRIIEDNKPDCGPYRVSTLAYTYRVMDEDEKEIIAYHWHPESDIKFPHLHVSKIGKKYHLATGRVSIEQFIRLVIRDFLVKPRNREWQRILAYTQGRFETYRTWS